MERLQSVLFRELERDEVARVWTIDRRESVENVYTLEYGELVLRPETYDMQGWPSGEPELYTPILMDCFDRGGVFLGAFEEGELVGAAVLDTTFIGRDNVGRVSIPDDKNQLQLKFLHVSHSHRGRGLGRLLFEQAVERARELDARRLYISATPSENTVDFYLHLGCVVAEEVDEALFELEPEDIHMVYSIPPS
ncbi:MAG: GNAT family N-acetyltransferase [Anaerolineae bacterium]|jgi:predicted N-acetyltransferase YhbS